MDGSGSIFKLPRSEQISDEEELWVSKFELHSKQLIPVRFPVQINEVFVFSP
jgi:hypothetical protein